MPEHHSCSTSTIFGRCPATVTLGLSSQTAPAGVERFRLKFLERLESGSLKPYYTLRARDHRRRIRMLYGRRQRPLGFTMATSVLLYARWCQGQFARAPVAAIRLAWTG